ncbi:hypothetical protein HY732_00690 [Candidatus Uhrbacteria bacterium]|nr:hypothetical protein [Candidatus Uhrbacteria bacterium]
MTAYDLFLLVATICIIFLTGFACAALYYLTRILQIWGAVSRQTEQNIQQCVYRFSEALHSIASLKNIIEIGLQTLKAAGAAYAVSRDRKRTTRKKQAQSHEE